MQTPVSLTWRENRLKASWSLLNRTFPTSCLGDDNEYQVRKDSRENEPAAMQMDRCSQMKNPVFLVERDLVVTVVVARMVT